MSVGQGFLHRCFLGLLFAAAVRFGHCSEQPELCELAERELLSQVIQDSFRTERLTVEVMLGSRWPVLRALDQIRTLAPFEDGFGHDMFSVLEFLH